MSFISRPRASWIKGILQKIHSVILVELKKIALLAFVSLSLLMLSITYALNVLAWSNGGYSDNPSSPDYGTHDWIAEHALDWLPENEKLYIEDNLATYLYGTELPDNGIALDGIGDTAKHHIYYWSNGSLQDDASAVRADEEYNNTLTFLNSGELANASKTAGIMSHYIVDMAVFGHVMGSSTDWGTENHHSDYENYVNQRTNSYYDEFNTYLSFDGELTIVSAYDVANELAYDTTFDMDGDFTCVWMDQNYNWSDPIFKDRCGESLNLAVNYLTDLLHTLYLEVASVHNIDSGKSFSAIQEAINDNETQAGHTILVDVGTYYEHVVINKSISLIGESKHTVIVDGNYTGNVIYIIANNVNITGFTVRNSGPDYPNSGIRAYSSHGHNIRNNIVANNGYGIWLQESSNHTTSGNNIINNNCPGIGLFGSSGNTITGNNITKNTGGIGLYESSNNIVSGNNITKNGVDINGVGIALGYSSNNSISGNNLIANNGHGIRFGESSDNTIFGNSIIDSYYGIYIDYSSNDNILASNLVGKNTYAVLLDSSSNNTFYHNNFIENTLVYIRMDTYTNFWDNGLEGNYWSTYNGTDSENDGIGDTPYIIDENNQDNHPLMGMFYDFTVEIELGQIRHVWVISNSTVSNLEVRVWLTSPNEYLQPGDKFIHYVVDGEEGSVGFCRVLIPRAVLNDSYIVLVDWQEVPVTELLISNSTHAYLYFTYNHSPHEVIIVPEFPILTPMLLVLVVLTVAIAIYKQRLLKTPTH